MPILSLAVFLCSAPTIDDHRAAAAVKISAHCHVVAWRSGYLIIRSLFD